MAVRFGTHRRGIPMGHQVLFGLAGLLSMLAAGMLLAIGLVVTMHHDESSLGSRVVPYATAIDQAALDAKGIANDQRGFLLTGDTQFVEEADTRIAAVRASFAAAEAAAVDARHRQAVNLASTGFERWVLAVRDEFAAYRAGRRQAAIDASNGPDRQMRKDYEQALAAAQDLARRSLSSAQQSVDASSSRSIWILSGVLVVALALGGVVATWLLRTIARPLLRLVDLLGPELA